MNETTGVYIKVSARYTKLQYLISWFRFVTAVDNMHKHQLGII